jgi:hypothetical protein
MAPAAIEKSKKRWRSPDSGDTIRGVIPMPELPKMSQNHTTRLEKCLKSYQAGDLSARDKLLNCACDRLRRLARPGDTTINIVVNGDSKKEADETFYLDLFGNSSNSLFTKNRGLGTILNDD